MRIWLGDRTDLSLDTVRDAEASRFSNLKPSQFVRGCAAYGPALRQILGIGETYGTKALWNERSAGVCHAEASQIEHP